MPGRGGRPCFTCFTPIGLHFIRSVEAEFFSRVSVTIVYETVPANRRDFLIKLVIHKYNSEFPRIIRQFETFSTSEKRKRNRRLSDTVAKAKCAYISGDFLIQVRMNLRVRANLAWSGCRAWLDVCGKVELLLF